VPVSNPSPDRGENPVRARFALPLLPFLLTALVGAGPAAAVTPVPPDNAIVAVGSHSAQSLFGQWATAYNAISPARPLVSDDSTGTPTLQAKTSVNCAVPRPAGDFDAITRLRLSPQTGDGFPCLDIARVESGTTSPFTNGITGVVTALDAVTWAANRTSNAPATLTTAQLRAIYSCAVTTWNQVGGTSTAAIVPVLPDAASGVRATFLGGIGLTAAGGCVVNAAGDQPIEESEGTNPVFNGAIAANVVEPFSIAAFVAQTAKLSSPDTTGTMVLRRVSNVSPTTGTGTSTVINTGFPAVLFTVVYAAVAGTGVPPTLQPLLGTGHGTGWLCTAPAARAATLAQAYLPNANCGVQVHT
jgi:hypothetical protein